ncbi:MAG: hypothetical protein WBO10_08655 [Pyrinomonadaceae bacterium]
MNKKISDEKVDQIMRTLMRDRSEDDSALDDIAESPHLWQGVQNRIDARVSEAFFRWPPRDLKKWFLIGVPAFAAVLVVISLIAFRTDPPAADLGAVRPVEVLNVESASRDTKTTANEFVVNGSEVIRNQVVPAKPERKKTVRREGSLKRDTWREQQKKSNNSPTEIKSEFIALTYAAQPDSGQIVRVKVPSSMMVRLGLVASVKVPSSLVDAEVVIGDDGQTHAIRFIR